MLLFYHIGHYDICLTVQFQFILKTHTQSKVSK